MTRVYNTIDINSLLLSEDAYNALGVAVSVEKNFTVFNPQSGQNEDSQQTRISRADGQPFTSQEESDLDNVVSSHDPDAYTDEQTLQINQAIFKSAAKSDAMDQFAPLLALSPIQAIFVATGNEFYAQQEGTPGSFTTVGAAATYVRAQLDTEFTVAQRALLETTLFSLARALVGALADS